MMLQVSAIYTTVIIQFVLNILMAGTHLLDDNWIFDILLSFLSNITT